MNMTNHPAQSWRATEARSATQPEPPCPKTARGWQAPDSQGPAGQSETGEESVAAVLGYN